MAAELTALKSISVVVGATIYHPLTDQVCLTRPHWKAIARAGNAIYQLLVHNMLRVRVCAAHMGGFVDPKLSKQGSLF